MDFKSSQVIYPGSDCMLTCCTLNENSGKTNFNRFACFWPKGYQLGSLGKSHQNDDYLKQAMRKIVFPQESNLQPLDYRSTALPLELEKTPPRMLNFGYLNPATCLLYDCNDKSIKMFLYANYVFVMISMQTSKNILIDLSLQKQTFEHSSNYFLHFS